ncbi:MAG: hypothetical protein IJ218_04530 [Alphaproteobacteria bacterium]|nr:hypothetical protein [Alphaproteobacteria bacterium]
MKKIAFIGMFALLCTSCITKPEPERTRPEPEAAPQENTMNVPADIDMSQVYTYSPQTEENFAPTDDDFYRRNIVVKAYGDDYVVYEYSDVRIDQVASLASHYCYDINPCKSAYLRDLYMSKNHKRRATFECIDLASE